MRKLTLAIVALLVAGLCIGCAQAAPAAAPAQPATGPTALTVKGKVATELALTLDSLKALGVVKVTAEHPKKGPTEYEGVRLKAVLDKAGVQGGADAVFTAGDGFEATVAVADLNTCADCLVAIGSDSALSMVMPGQPSKAWVKDVVSIEIK
ncbi:MAG TPA: molybdopterin-dependent oxidoreductase [Anaerolineae bacterium]|nr:molybdopterin-dependent oxidoreductase [Anaerolineae bacterium]HOR00470.1 molybdopterin-dependent oxidoreductase [Anaerolineae bacterium]HPL30835.1 molybdopterin-dependent oxidoreductase [Anaerolineae bacterium]